MDKITWFELNRTNNGTPAITAYAGTLPVYSHYFNTLEELNSWCKNFPGVNIIVVADTSKNIPKCPDFKVGKLPGSIPFAKTISCGMKVQGKYRKGFPEGLIVHFTAGRGSAEDMVEWCAGKGYTLCGMGKDGEIVQAAPLDSWGYHCGNKYAETHLGVEIVNAGRLEKRADGTFWSWFGTQIPSENVRHIDDTKEQIEGYYEKFTPQQEESLIKLCLWLKDNSSGIFSLENVIGHDESCARTGNRGRKNDCGGSLSMLMPDFCKFLLSK